MSALRNMEYRGEARSNYTMQAHVNLSTDTSHEQ